MTRADFIAHLVANGCVYHKDYRGLDMYLNEVVPVYHLLDNSAVFKTETIALACRKLKIPVPPAHDTPYTQSLFPNL